MQSSVKRISESDEPEGKRVKSTASLTVARLWLLMNYEYSEGKYCKTDDVWSHLESEMQNFDFPSDINKSITGRLIQDIWGSCIRNVQKRFMKERENKTRVYMNLSRKEKKFSMQEQVMGWKEIENKLREEVEKKTNWQFKQLSKNKFTCIYLHFESFDRLRVITEICVSKNVHSGKEDIEMTHHGREVQFNPQVHNILTQLQGTINKVVFLMSFVTSSNICSGFSVNDENTTKYKGSIVRVLKDMDGEHQEERLFSQKCEVFTNWNGYVCSMCRYAENAYKLSQKRNLGESIDPKCNHRYMSREMLIEKIEEEKLNKKRERHARQEAEDELFKMIEEDHYDLEKMMKSIKKEDVPEKMADLWLQQIEILESPSKNGYRWHPQIMRLCIELYTKNPHVLDPLREVLYLPSNRTIRYHKNKVEEKCGWNRQMIEEWCLKEAKSKQLREQDYWGGFVLDEMKIQEDLEMVIKDGAHKLVGFVDLGDMHDNIELLSGNNQNTPKLATHVLQFVFIGDSGFRFPIAQFPSNACTPSDLTVIFWEGVLMMKESGFTVYWCVLDGAEVNRQFVKLHFTNEDEAVAKHFVCQNIFTGDPVVFMFDCKHNFKKIRNNILKSTQGNEGTRCLTTDKGVIVWKQLVSAFDFDQDTFSMPLHERLTIQHFELDPASKMRNSLAEDVLDRKMLSLVKAHKDHLNSTGRDGRSLDGLIQLLDYTSRMIQLFNDKEAIRHIDDRRLKELSGFLEFLTGWKSTIDDDNKKFFSLKLWFDLRSMILGFKAMVAIKKKEFPQAIIKPAIVNQDAVENHFCQVRACNGQNNNPTFRLQQTVQNSIRFGQKTISRKSNSGKSSLTIKHS